MKDFLKKLQEFSVARSKNDFKVYDNGGPSFFGLALGGEIGEIQNLVKKLERAKLGGPNIGHTTHVEDITLEKLEDEFGGALIYFVILASFYADKGLDLERAAIKTFNSVSDELGSIYRFEEEE